MSSADAVAGILWVGVTVYAVFGGADFGAGFWGLLAGGGERGRRARELIDWAIGPVWEANHVWLIFVLVVLWTGFSAAFEAIISTLFIPLSLAALGIVLRGSGFAFHKTAPRLAAGALAERLFGLSSLLTPFFMGTVVGAVASGRVPVGNATGDPVTSWLNPLSLLIGVLFVATCAYLAAVFLISDARRAGAPISSATSPPARSRPRSSRARSPSAGIFVLHSDARYVYDGLTGEGLPLVIAVGACGLAVLVLLRPRRPPRRAAARRGRGRRGDLGLGVAQYPYLLPQTLTIVAGRRAERHPHGGADRVRRRGRAGAAVASRCSTRSRRSGNSSRSRCSGRPRRRSRARAPAAAPRHRPRVPHRRGDREQHAHDLVLAWRPRARPARPQAQRTVAASTARRAPSPTSACTLGSSRQLRVGQRGANRPLVVQREPAEETLDGIHVGSELGPRRAGRVVRTG